jgi:DNA polymerase-1
VRADYVACVFDAKGPTFRDAIYPEYKAQRSPMPDDLRAQIPPIHEVVRLLGWPVLDVPGVEADDVIGTLAVTAARQGIEVIVSSGDKDLAQLVNEHITIIDTMNGKRRDLAGVEAEFGVPARLMVDFQTLVGDRWTTCPAWKRSAPRPPPSGCRNTARSTRWWPTPTRSRAWPARTCARRWTGCPPGGRC